MSSQIVSDIESIDRKQWQDYVENHAQGNAFQTPQMYSIYNSSEKYRPLVLACYRNNSIVGILLAVIQSEYKGFLGKLSSRSIIWGGPLADSDEIQSELLSRYNEIIGRQVVFSQVRNTHVLNSIQKRAFELNGFRYEPHLNILVDLPADVDQFWKGIKHTRKNGINKAKRQGFVFEAVSEPLYLDPFYLLLENLYKRIKLPYPHKSLFDSLYCEAGEFVKWFVLKKDDIPIVVLVAFIFKETIYAYCIGTSEDEAILNLRPIDLFYYEVMCWGIKNGYKKYDWLGAGKPDQEYGVRKFKIQYGGELIEMGRFIKIHKPLIMRMSKIGFWCLAKTREGEA